MVTIGSPTALDRASDHDLVGSVNSQGFPGGGEALAAPAAPAGIHGLALPDTRPPDAEASMTRTELIERYREYIDCLNSRDWPALGRFVDETVQYNGQQIGLAGYRRLLEEDVRRIPDLQFEISLLIAEPPRVACRLSFACTPVGELFGFAVNGRHVSFTENVFYAFRDGKIHEVWSVIDKAAVGAQCQG